MLRFHEQLVMVKGVDGEALSSVSRRDAEGASQAVEAPSAKRGSGISCPTATHSSVSIDTARGAVFHVCSASDCHASSLLIGDTSGFLSVCL